MRKFTGLIMSIFILFAVLVPVSKSTVSADTVTSNDTTPYPTGAWFEDGKLIFVQANKKATASIKYGTKAFVFRTTRTCSSESASASQCGPLKGTTDDYLRT
ncbi:hypothetical protein [Cohnella fermenti]|uniref:Uncharacterized protein n=1 Tax=Cohnella fermenti TaxID=2565925 RepID=A0A4S4BKL0_9BACL|nr:hypothetical protein [Cohnella fermenti]THF75270.1 hypothetical protein E6C55_22675 [Cohnella fermenti]